MAHFNLDLDLDKSQAVGQVVRARVGDVESCVIAATIYDHGSEVDLAGMGARFCMLKPDRTVIEDDDCEVSGSTVTHTLGTQATAAAGVAELAYFEILDGSTVIDSTQGFRLVIEPDAEGSGTGPSEDYISRVDAATEAATEAAEAAAGAAQSANAAAKAATDAAGGATRAAQSANAAAEAAGAAAEAARGNVLTGKAEGYVAHADDAYSQKPREVRIKGKTWVNRWPVINTPSYGVTTDETGLITVNATPESTQYANAEAQGIAANKAYTLSVSNASGASDSTWIAYVEERDAAGAYITSYAITGSRPSVTFTTASNCAQLVCMIIVHAGYAANLTTRVMLVEGTEAPDCFTPPASITSVQPGNLVTSGKNLFQYTKQAGIFFTGGTLQAGTYTMSLESLADWWTNNGGNGRYIYYYMYDNLEAAAAAAAAAAGSALRGFTSSGGVNFANADIGVRSSATLTLKTSGCILLVAYYGATWIDQVTDIQLELGSTATAYEPPNVTTTPLPEVELRGLPDGTCDELVIRSDGTCEVERQLEQKTIDAEHPIKVDQFIPASGTDLPYVMVGSLFPPFDFHISDTYKVMYSTSWPYTEDLKSRGVYRTWNTTIFVDERFTDKEAAQSIINEVGGTFVASVPSTAEPQSPVALPILPAPTFNQYHDADVPSDTSVEYERDVTIAFDRLQAQVSATTVREATNG